MLGSQESETPKFIGSTLDGQKFKIDGVNVWDQKWKAFGTVAEVIHPRHKEKHVFQLYSIMKGEKEIKFLAGEFSNTVWGFYWPPASLLLPSESDAR
jgi:hypothetical protein